MNARTGIILMILTSMIFAAQDGISRHLASTYNVWMVVMIRYWFFALFVMTISARRTGGLAAVTRPARPVLQAFRGVLLAAEICVMVSAFAILGLVESHAIFAGYPLIVAALSGPLLGETVGWRRWVAIGIGFVGVVIIIGPGMGVFSVYALIPLASSTMFALYNLLTRLAAKTDTAATSFFWTGVVGAVAMTPIGLWTWETMAPSDWIWMATLCVTGAAGHYTLIKCYEFAEASTVQPFAFLQMVFAASVGILVFGETLTTALVIGAVIVVGAGLFTLWRERVSGA